MYRGGYMDPLMQPTTIQSNKKSVTGDDLELVIQDNIIAKLRAREWMARPVTASAAVYGWPDIYAAHRQYGQRWIEVKRLPNYSFTSNQLKYFPMMQSAGVGIWILTNDTDEELAKLFKPPNWYTYLSIYGEGGRGVVADRAVPVREHRRGRPIS